MPGLRVASTDGTGWTVETVELALTSRLRRRGHAEPLGDGAHLCVRRHRPGGRVLRQPGRPGRAGRGHVPHGRGRRWLSRTAGSGSRPPHTSLPGRRPTARRTSGSPHTSGPGGPFAARSPGTISTSRPGAGPLPRCSPGWWSPGLPGRHHLELRSPAPTLRSLSQRHGAQYRLRSVSTSARQRPRPPRTSAVAPAGSWPASTGRRSRPHRRAIGDASYSVPRRNTGASDSCASEDWSSAQIAASASSNSASAWASRQS